MSIVVAFFPEMLKPKIKESFPEVTFLTSEMDASTHGKKRVRKPKIKVDTDVNGCDPVPVV
jgi:hypothetical protein